MRILYWKEFYWRKVEYSSLRGYSDILISRKGIDVQTEPEHETKKALKIEYIVPARSTTSKIRTALSRVAHYRHGAASQSAQRYTKKIGIDRNKMIELLWVSQIPIMFVTYIY